MNGIPATDGTPEQGKTPPVNGQFPAPATGFRDYLIDAVLAFERNRHAAAGYEYDYPEVRRRQRAEELIDSAIRVTTEPQPEPEKQVTVYGIDVSEWDRMWATLRHVEQLLSPADAAHCGEECSEGHTYAGRCEQRVRDAETRAAVAEHDAEAQRNNVRALVRELIRERGGDPEATPGKLRVVIIGEDD